MNLRRSTAAERRRETTYDVVQYREALRVLGLFPPIAREDIQRAYRFRARQLHPDRFPEADQKDDATRRITRLNLARDYALRHYAGFDVYQERTFRERNGRHDGRDVASWQEWTLLPVTAVYAMAMVLAAMPILLIERLLDEERGERWREGRLTGAGAFAWRAWLVLGPHVVTAALFFLAGGLAFRLWFGVSFLVMASADMATLLTGATNTLRQHRTVTRLETLLRGA